MTPIHTVAPSFAFDCTVSKATWVCKVMLGAKKTRSDSTVDVKASRGAR
jgi:hypothetical protein